MRFSIIEKTAEDQTQFASRAESKLTSGIGI